MSLQYKWIIFVSLLLSSLSSAKGLVFSDDQIIEIGHIARDISALNPKLSKPKYFEYAIGIYDACSHYGIDPQLLVSITAQESSFRENLAEGAAGEFGMTQIRKNWLENKEFRTEFPNATEASLNMPATSFRYSAWLLSHLKISEVSDKLPYWTYYNARGFEPRKRYFKRVYDKLRKIRKLRNERLAKSTVAKRVERTVAKYEAPKQLAPVRRIRSNTKLSARAKMLAIYKAKERRLALQKQQDEALQALRREKVAPILEVAQKEVEPDQEEFQPIAQKARPEREEPVRNPWIATALDDVNREYQLRQRRYEQAGMLPADFAPRKGYVAPAVSSTAQELGLTGPAY